MRARILYCIFPQIYIFQDIKDSYKPKDSEMVTMITTFVNCLYWINLAIATHLTKSTLVEVSGRIGINTWIKGDGEAKASLTFHMKTIILHGRSNAAGKESILTTAEITEPIEDLPLRIGGGFFNASLH